MQVVVQQIEQINKIIHILAAVNKILTFIEINPASHRIVISDDLLPNPDSFENLVNNT